VPLKKLREVFVTQPMLRKNLSQIFKIHLHFPRIHFERRRSKIGKNGKKKKEKWFYFREGGIPDPPKGVSGFFLGGGSHEGGSGIFKGCRFVLIWYGWDMRYKVCVGAEGG
jgi:hypothetical protein